MAKVRFAPSPTGYLHIGGVRTALFNYLYARAQKGEFLLRIEDTDRERSKPEFEEEILSSLKWLGLNWDGDLVHQSSRLERYREVADELVKNGAAYVEEHEGKKAVRFKMPSREVILYDLVHGETRFDTSLFDDLVILKSDGYPTYHLAVVVDDHDSEVTHIIRGDDHLSNTPRQLLLYEAMGWKAPKYAHLPLILGSDGSPLSKRHGTVAISQFKKDGFLPEAMLNYLALLGWGSGSNQEFYTLDDLCSKFSVKRINKANAQFNLEKLLWMNSQHIKQLPAEEYINRLTAFDPSLKEGYSEDAWKALVLLFQTRIKTWKDLASEASYLFTEDLVYDAQQSKEFCEDPDKLKAVLVRWADEAEKISDFSSIQDLENLTRQLASDCGEKAGFLIHPLRYALTAKTVSPGLFELMAVLGREKCLFRTRQFIQVL